MSTILAGFMPAAAGVDDLTGIADEVTALVPVAMRLAGIVHFEDPADAHKLKAGLTDEQVETLLYVLAGMVDVDKSAEELLGWAGYWAPRRFRGVASVAPASVLTPDGKRVRYAQCGTQRGWEAHQAKNNQPCTECQIAHDVWLRANPQQEPSNAA